MGIRRLNRQEFLARNRITAKKFRASHPGYFDRWHKDHRKPCPECGKEIGYDSTTCASCSLLGERNHNWKGGRTIDVNGYVSIQTPHHPNANRRGYVLEHRLVMEAHLGRTLLPAEVVHHINGVVNDNRIENLMLFASNSGHAGFHRKGKKRYKNADS